MVAVHDTIDLVVMTRGCDRHVASCDDDVLSTRRRSTNVGIELPITLLVGKWTVSQNKSESDRAGAADGLQALGDPETVAMAMAELVRRSSGPQIP